MNLWLSIASIYMHKYKFKDYTYRIGFSKKNFLSFSENLIIFFRPINHPKIEIFFTQYTQGDL
jgi:hypothetical protein